MLIDPTSPYAEAAAMAKLLARFEATQIDNCVNSEKPLTH
jgi:hypothetical protein